MAEVLQRASRAINAEAIRVNRSKAKYDMALGNGKSLSICRDSKRISKDFWHNRIGAITRTDIK